MSLRPWLERRDTEAARWSPRRSHPLSGAESVGAYSAAIVVAELAGALGWVVGGAVLDAALLPLLLGNAVRPERRRYGKLFVVLALIAMLRVLSLTAAVPQLPVLTWYVTVGGALLIGEILTIRLFAEPWRRLHLAIRRPRLDLGMAAIGIPAGFIGYLLLRPQPLIPGADLVQTLAAIAVLIVFAAFTQELLYRGLLQSVAIEAFDDQRRLGLVYTAVISGAMYLGSGSFVYTIAVGSFGLLLGSTILRGGSVWGATASHGLALVGMAFVWPVLLGTP